jgi:Protein of unknown function (DUF1573)
MHKTEMGKRIGTGLMVLFFLLVSVPPAVSEEQKAPKAVVLEKAFDFGTVMEGDTITHSFKIANHGEHTLTINRVQPG